MAALAADDALAPLGLGPAPPDDAPFSLGHSLGLSAALDADSYVIERGLASPNSTLDDYLDGDTLPGQPALDLFDIDDFLSDEATHAAPDPAAAADAAAADHGPEPQVRDSEIQVS